MAEQRRVSKEEGISLAQHMKASFLETSARIGDNVDNVFLTLLHKIDPQEKDTHSTTSQHISEQRNQKGQDNTNARVSNNNTNKNCIVS